MSYKVRTIVCEGCGKEITRRMSITRKYCSLICYRSSKHPQRRTGKVIGCDWCKKRVYRPKSLLEGAKHHFCSVSCFNEWQSRNKLVFTCKICGKKFQWSLSRIKNNNPIYCSIECRNKDEEWIRNTCIQGNLIQQNKKGLNKLEKEGNKILDKLNLNYSTQYLIADKFLVDVFISPNIIIQWDGEYWHGHQTTTHYDNRQLQRMKLDKSQNSYLEKMGFKVLRFWSKQVYEEPNLVRQRIMEAIG